MQTAPDYESGAVCYAVTIFFSYIRLIVPLGCHLSKIYKIKEGAPIPKAISLGFF